MTADGERVQVLINVDDPALLDGLDPAHCDGIGLTRTEFLFQGTELPDEETQFGAYRRILEWAAGRPVIVRTLDAGGDKPIPGLTLDGERNPFLGLRGLRLSLARPEVFRVQLRALARAAALGTLKVMAADGERARRAGHRRGPCSRRSVAELHAAGVAAARPALGMMVEVPAAALTAAVVRRRLLLDRQQRPDPVRDGGEPRRARGRSALRPGNPAVLELIRQRGRGRGRARRRGRPVRRHGLRSGASPCSLLGLGLRRLSVAPAAARAGQGGDRAWPQER